MTESRTPLPTAYKDRTRLSSAPTVRIIPSFQRPQNKPKLLDLLREALRSRHYSRRTESAYCSWVKRFIYFHNVRHPAEMAEGRGRVQLPDALDRKYPNAPTDWRWQWVFPQAFFYHASLGEWIRHPYGPGTAGAQRCTNDHDLYACSEPGRSRSAQPGGQLIGRGRCVLCGNHIRRRN
jgi:hypothetical protein